MMNILIKNIWRIRLGVLIVVGVCMSLGVFSCLQLRKCTDTANRTSTCYSMPRVNAFRNGYLQGQLGSEIADNPRGSIIIMRDCQESQIIAINANDGSEYWSCSLAEASLQDFMVVHDGLVIIQAEQKKGRTVLYAIDAQSGIVQWDVQLPGYACYTLLDDIVAVRNDETLFGFDLKKRKVLWSYSSPSGFCGPIVSYESQLFFADCQGVLHAVDLNSSLVSWKHYLDGETVVSDIVCNDGCIFVVGVSGKKEGFISVTSLDENTGMVQWKQLFSEWMAIKSDPYTGGLRTACGNGVLYVSDRDCGCLYAMNQKNGTVKWKRDDVVVSMFTWPVAVINRGLVISQGPTIKAYSIKTGELLWTLADSEYQKLFEFSPAVATNRLFTYAWLMPDNVPCLESYNIETGRRIWSRRLPFYFSSFTLNSGPIIVD